LENFPVGHPTQVLFSRNVPGEHIKHEEFAEASHSDEEKFPGFPDKSLFHN
jgi:hypothetical protein